MMRRFLIVLLPAMLLACNQGDSKALPKPLIGYWTTNAPSYRGRFLELDRAYVIIGAGENGSPGVQVIDRVVSAPVTDGSGAATSYTIYSTTPAGIHDQFTIDYDSTNDGEIRFHNQRDVVWKRTEKGAPAASTAASQK